MLALVTVMCGCAVGARNWFTINPNAFEEMMDLASPLNRIRRGFGDFASLEYPWMPYDGDD
jgi:hypothetical protein